MRWDFPAIMVALVFICGVIWLMDELFLAPGRRRAATVGVDEEGNEIRVEAEMPKAVEYARSFFPVFLIVLLLRSFAVEPFRIPSGSMMPTLQDGDFILVHKYQYGLRLPVLDTKVVDLGSPERGDVVVFRYPVDPAIPFIKRIVGLPGDTIEYRNKTLFLNGKEVEQTKISTYLGAGSGSDATGSIHYLESLPGRPHDILVNPRFSGRTDGRTEVPEGHYFVLGDNRDNSQDSRYWGFVPDENLIGRAFMIWFNWDWGHGRDWGRVGTSIQ
jgi:signal peptidase I